MEKMRLENWRLNIVVAFQVLIVLNLRIILRFLSNIKTLYFKSLIFKNKISLLLLFFYPKWEHNLLSSRVLKHFVLGNWFFEIFFFNTWYSICIWFSSFRKVPFYLLVLFFYIKKKCLKDLYTNPCIVLN